MPSSTFSPEHLTKIRNQNHTQTTEKPKPQGPCRTAPGREAHRPAVDVCAGVPEDTLITVWGPSYLETIGGHLEDTRNNEVFGG